MAKQSGTRRSATQAAPNAAAQAEADPEVPEVIEITGLSRTTIWRRDRGGTKTSTTGSTGVAPLSWTVFG